ncbi:MAG: ABC transporter permease [Ktedonobacteraceae bacterium]|nr:ABC transporter permease [Ktedonobacteraceae bacterium]
MSITDQVREPSSKAKAPDTKQFALPPLKAKDFDRTGKMGSNISIAFEGLWANRLRSMLTALGIFIGVAAVIAAIILTQGVSASITNSITSLGTNVITVASGASSNGAARGPAASVSATSTTPSITATDAKLITKVPDVTGITPVIAVSEQAIYGNQNWNTRVQGVMPVYQNIQNWTLSEGIWYTESDEQAAKTVALIGPTVANNLFSATGDDPLGKSIRIGSQVFRVGGVLTAKGGNSDDIIYVPFATAQNRLKNSTYVDQILVQVDDSSNINQVQKDITSILEKSHHIAVGAADDFNLTNSTQLLQTASTFTSTLTLLLVSVAGISLTVGGIGIMNIMIVSVTERTREIGIRISIGAQRGDIRNQFLIEALVLSLAGGIIGMLLGLLIGYAGDAAIKLPFVVSATTLLMPFAISATIGVIFGLYPAIRASRLDPIDALRSA